MKALLDGVNQVLTKVGVLDSNSGLLANLVNSGKQTFIDLAVQVLNETVDEIYSLLDKPKPTQLAESTITLVADDRDYVLATDLVMLLPDFGLISESDSHVIFILKDDGYRQIILGDLEQDDTGLPTTAAIRPTDGQLFMDRTPTSAQAGRIYRYRYTKELELVAATDEFPFGNTVFRAVVPAAAEMWKRERHKDFSQGLVKLSLGRAARLISKQPARDSWMPGHNVNPTDPFES